MAIPRYRLAAPAAVVGRAASGAGARLEIPPNQTSIARVRSRHQTGGTPLNWGRLWLWLGTGRDAKNVVQTVEARFSGDKIP